MTQDYLHAIITILILAVITFLIRALPFLLFRGNKTVPEFVTYLGKVLPYALIAMLVVYCLKDVSFLQGGTYGIPEAISIIFIVIIHKLKHNMLLSVGLGTVLYMVLVQFLF